MLALSARKRFAKVAAGGHPTPTCARGVDKGNWLSTEVARPIPLAFRASAQNQLTA